VKLLPSEVLNVMLPSQLPAGWYNFRICRSRDGRNAGLVEDFVDVAREIAGSMGLRDG